MPYWEDATTTLYLGDCRDVLPTIEAADLIVTDPPYTFGIASTSGESKKSGGWGDLMNSAAWYAIWLKECQRITSHRTGAAWVFNSWRSFPVLCRAAFEATWPITSLLVWDKEWIGPGGHQGLRPSYELVALFTQPGFAIGDRGLPDIWKYPVSAFKPTGHPAEKPVDLVSRIIQESGGDLIIDPFLGSGTTAVACRMLGRRCIGIEIEPRWLDLAIARLQQQVLPLDVPAVPLAAQSGLFAREGVGGT